MIDVFTDERSVDEMFSATNFGAVRQLHHPADLVALVRFEEVLDPLGAAVGRAEEVLDAEVGVDHRVDQLERVRRLRVAPLQVAHEARAASPPSRRNCEFGRWQKSIVKWENA